MALVFVAAMIGVCAVLLRRDTWRRDQPPPVLERPEVHEGDLTPPRVSRIDEMTQLTECFAAFQGDGAQKHLLALRPQPLTRWNDPNYDVIDAGLWAWGDRGRPMALLMLEGSPPSADPGGDLGSWAFELVALSNEKIEVEGTNDIRAMNAKYLADAKPVMTGAIHWSPKRSSLAFRNVPDAPTPARTEPRRLTQMNELIKRFSAVVHPGSRGPKLEQKLDPVYRYSDPEAEQLDGAIFLFGVGKNPEVLVLLEAQGPSAEKATWRYAAAPATVASYIVEIDGKEAVNSPYHSEKHNTPIGSYFTVRMPRLKDEG
jgi:hypothetical protein